MSTAFDMRPALPCFVWNGHGLRRAGGPYDGRPYVLEVAPHQESFDLIAGPRPPMRGGGYRRGRKPRPDVRPRAVERHRVAVDAYMRETTRRAMRTVEYMGRRFAAGPAITLVIYATGEGWSDMERITKAVNALTLREVAS